MSHSVLYVHYYEDESVQMAADILLPIEMKLSFVHPQIYFYVLNFSASKEYYLEALDGQEKVFFSAHFCSKYQPSPCIGIPRNNTLLTHPIRSTPPRILHGHIFHTYSTFTHAIYAHCNLVNVSVLLMTVRSHPGAGTGTYKHSEYCGRTSSSVR